MQTYNNILNALSQLAANTSWNAGIVVRAGLADEPESGYIDDLADNYVEGSGIVSFYKTDEGFLKLGCNETSQPITVKKLYDFVRSMFKLDCTAELLIGYAAGIKGLLDSNNKVCKPRYVENCDVREDDDMWNISLGGISNSYHRFNEAVNRFDLSTKKGTASEILTTNFERFNSCKTFEDVEALCHELLDGAVDTAWSRKFFFQLATIKRRNPNPRSAYEQAMLYVNNARMRGMGLGMSRRFYEDDELNEAMDDKAKKEFMDKLRAGEVEFKYMKKDGSERKAKGTMDPKLMNLPEKKEQADVDKAETKQKKARKLPADSVFYYDLESKGFRSFKMANFIGYV